MEVRLTRHVRLCLLVIVQMLLIASCSAGKKENEAMRKRCDACTLVAEKFKEGMDRTERLMYDGGDADWEEKKLGSYATSEMRFIEITETLCENKEHNCHNLLELKEELLEHWWKEHQTDSPDLFQWFCLENYKVCCPENTFGPDCTECPYGTERPCKDNGKCMGAGTRAGTGKCKCKAGYKGELCDICKDGFYQVMQNETHTECKACHKACTALCTGQGPKGCKKCKIGWLWDEEEGCQDVDECKADEPPCKEDEFCENAQGSYKCEKCDQTCEKCLGPGKAQCVKCKVGNEMKEDGCGDVDECAQEGICKTSHMSCHNVPGSYYCDCAEGYERVGGECMDKEVLKANNESGQASGESSGELESTIGPEGEISATDTNGGIVNEGSGSADENVREDIAENEQNVDQILSSHDNQDEPGREIPNSPDDLKDGSDQNGSKVFQSEDSDNIPDEKELSKDIPISESPHSEL